MRCDDTIHDEHSNAQGLVQGSHAGVQVFRNETPRGSWRAELALGPADRIIVDGRSAVHAVQQLLAVLPAALAARPQHSAGHTMPTIHQIAREAPAFMHGEVSALARPRANSHCRCKRHTNLDVRYKCANIVCMELTLQLKLLPTEDQTTALRATMARFNEACNWLAEQAFAKQCSNKLTLQRLYYFELRTRFALPSQMAVRCLARVAGTYRRDKSICPTFRPDAAMPYDQRIMRFDGLDQVSLLTLQGRVLVSFLVGPYHRARFDAYEPRQCHLVVREDGQWFLLVVVVVPDGTPMPPTDFLGVDFGVVNLATTSDGTTHSGEGVEACRTRYAKSRQRLQRAAHVAQMDAKRPKNIRRALKRTARREARFRRDTNHCISKTLVATATGNGCGIALEDLTALRSRTRFRKPQRAQMAGWAFAQLRFFVEYKAQLAGVPVVLVDPRNTSRGCNQCGHVAKANRQTQARFSCNQCGYTTNADFNAALNIRLRAHVMAPQVAGASDPCLRAWAGSMPATSPWL